MPSESDAWQPGVRADAGPSRRARGAGHPAPDGSGHHLARSGSGNDAHVHIGAAADHVGAAADHVGAAADHRRPERADGASGTDRPAGRRVRFCGSYRQDQIRGRAVCTTKGNGPLRWRRA